ncbi:MAG: peroxiredoxin [Ferrovum sp. 37-45-19]|jgi:peroxiredoxin Q/BCP|uniref:peroxiredoxin n=1 Tax=Ferrovum sp. JA12 TaxID=1356299 RepID=UPI0007025EFF|nr:peroxiredoxin [Ferrovum sp. JA12]OYV78679.1 MAG: peroxiredoxin [Ferrovum sp. 21-44-67]OYV93244.1 MAG: peroxiredoxin [Ferrovum sp. 37-45-19]OZB33203.1 MAG: peroxiredoxin [Ferrovum sp. 34-44-207]HQT82359.1 peroxiredoxin [Ferrovaceae bacterium]KRH79918.1 putative peroxiredoxin bcp [Ferrovum sp. JA12]
MKLLLLTLSLFVGLALVFSKSASASDLPTVGQVAPDFKVIDQHNQLQSLANYRGKWIVLYFYPKDETPGCTTEACAYRDDFNQVKKMDGVILGVSIDDASSHAEFAANHHLPFPLLADKDGSISRSYGSERSLLGYKIAKRNTFIIDPKGNIAKVYESVDAGENPKEVIADLRQMIEKK